MSVPDARRWLSYASSDLRAAHALLRDADHYPRQVCFLAQQAAEKAFKAILVLLQIEFPRTHDLDRLRELLPSGMQIKTEFPQLYGLSIWAVEARYPGNTPDALEIDAEEALRMAEEIYQAVSIELGKSFPDA